MADVVIDDYADDDKAADPLARLSARERAEAAGAAFEVQSAPGQGTLVRARIALAQ